MSTRITIETLVELADGDREFVTLLIEEGVIESKELGYRPEDVDRVLAAYTLTRNLGVNMPGVDIILRLRHELAQARRELAALASKLSDPKQR
jgi:hypothetical protein